MKAKLTLEEIRRMDKDWLTPEEASGPLGCTGHLLGWMCHNEPEKVQFPFICINSKTIIPRTGYLNWFDGMKYWVLPESWREPGQGAAEG